MGKVFRKWKDSRPPWDRRKCTFRRYRQAKHKIQSKWKRGQKYMRITRSLPYHLRADFSMAVKVVEKLYSEKEMKGYTGNLRNFEENPPKGGGKQ